jgi:hypothetical protein
VEVAKMTFISTPAPDNLVWMTSEEEVKRIACTAMIATLDNLIHEYDSGDHPEISDCDTTDEWYGHGWDDCRDAFVQHLKSLRNTATQEE